MSAESYPDLLERLFAAFEDRHTLAVIEEVADGAEANSSAKLHTAPSSSCWNGWRASG